MLRILRLLHTLIVAFVVFGWALPFPGCRIAHLVLIPLLYLHWKTNNDRCFLSNLEERLQGMPAGKSESAPFVRSLFRKYFKLELSDKGVKQITYGMMLACWSLSLLLFFTTRE